MIKGKNIHLHVKSNLILSEDCEKMLFEKVKPDNIFLYLIIKNENKIVNRFLEEWISKIYSLELQHIDNNLFKKVLSVNKINLINELIITGDIDDDNKSMLFKDFLPKCSNLKTLILSDFPQKSENYGNFLENSKSLEKLEIDFSNYKSLDTLNYILLKDNHLKSLKINFNLYGYDETTYEMDFSFVKLLQDLEYFQLSIVGEKGMLLAKNLINGLNSIKKLKYMKIDFDGDLYFPDINNINNPSLKQIFIFCTINDFKTIIENNPNLEKINLFYFDYISDKQIKFPEKLEKITLKIKDDKILLQLFKQIQLKPLPLLELDIRVEWLFGKITNNTFHEMAGAFKFLHKLKKLYIKGLGQRNDDNKGNIEWLQNLKYLVNLEYFEIMYYSLTIEELEVFLQSVQNLTFLFEIKFYDNKFSYDKVIKLLKKYKLPPQLRFFNLFNQCYQNEDDEDEDEDEDEDNNDKEDKNDKKDEDKDKDKDKDKNNDKIEYKDENKDIYTNLIKDQKYFGYPKLEETSFPFFPFEISIFDN